MDIETAKSILIANLKGSKKKRSPLLTIAEATRVLITEYGTANKIAHEFDVSRPIIESFDKMNDQPKEIKKLIQEGKILIDASTKLSTISDLSKRVELANAVAGLTAFDARYVIDYWKKHPELSGEESKRIALGSKTVTKEIHILVVPLEAEQYNEFRFRAKNRGLNSDAAAKEAILEWLTRQKKEDMI